jgi:hypothetical protein
MRSATDIAQDAFDQLQMKIARIMHEQANLLNSVG